MTAGTAAKGDTTLALSVTHFAQVYIAETAIYLPARVTTDALFGAAAPELVRVTGVIERPVAPPELATSDLIIAAARALPTSPDRTDHIDRVIVATVTPDHPSPATAPLVQHGLGLPHVPAFDVAAACAGFVYALDLAARSITCGDPAVLVAAGECRFRTLHAASPGVRALFGVGAAAARITSTPTVVSPSAAVAGKPLRLLATGLGADGSGHSAIRVEAGGSRHPTTAATVAAGLHALRMDDGAHVFMKATESFVALADAFLAALDLTLADIAWIVPHQPNVRILERVARLLRFPRERFVITADRLGNIGGASAAIALHEVRAHFAPGDKVLLLTAGAGYTAGAALLEAFTPC